MAFLFIIISVFLYYITAIDQLLFSELSMSLMELQTTIKLPLWLVPLALGIMLQARKLMKRNQQEAALHNETSQPAKTTLNKVEDPVERAQLSASWKNDILDRIHAIKLPAGASIETDPFKGVPLGLKLERTTPQATRKALEEFSLLLSQLPIPPRVFIKLLDEMKTEVPPKNLVKGAFQKHLNVMELSIVSQMDGIDVRFHKPDPLWENDPNLGFDIEGLIYQ